MISAGTLTWYAQHETRLAWRDWAWLLSGGRRRRGYRVVLGLLAFVIFLHGLAYLTLARSADLASPPDKRLLVTLAGILLLYWSLMLSQAMEAVTRAFYARGDLELILSSPASAPRLCAVRIGAMAMAVAAMSVGLTIALFRVIGPKRTRLVSQIVAAVIGASFVIGVQFVAILSVGTPSRVAFFQSQVVIDHAPDS